MCLALLEIPHRMKRSLLVKKLKIVIKAHFRSEINTFWYVSLRKSVAQRAYLCRRRQRGSSALAWRRQHDKRRRHSLTSPSLSAQSKRESRARAQRRRPRCCCLCCWCWLVWPQFLSAMNRTRASRDLNQLFCFVKLGCFSAFWFVCQNFGLFARIWFVFHIFNYLENIFCIQISLKK